MNVFISWMLIPCLTILLPGRTDWFTSNFSVVGSMFPQNVFLLIWAVITGSFYRTFTKRSIGRTVSFITMDNELFLTDISVFLLIGAVFLPYRPDQNPLISVLHLAMAFTATVLFYLAVTMADLKLYFLAPDLFSLPTALLVFAAAATFCLLILCNFIISSALEIFLTIFSCIWLNIFDRRVRRFIRRTDKTLSSGPLPKV